MQEVRLDSVLVRNLKSNCLPGYCAEYPKHAQ
jgi:hypothetical protein